VITGKIVVIIDETVTISGNTSGIVNGIVVIPGGKRRIVD